MIFNTEIEIGLTGARGNKTLDKVAAHCTRVVPHRLPALLADAARDESPDLVARVIDYSCRLGAAGLSGMVGKANLLLTMTIVVRRAPAASTDGEDLGDDADEVEEPELSETEIEELRLRARAFIEAAARAADVAGDSGAEAKSFSVRVKASR